MRLAHLLATLSSAALADHNERTLSVSGEAEVRVVPNQVTVVVGVESFDKELARAKQDNDERVKRIISSARATGVEDKRIATDSIDLQPEYRNDSSSNYARSLTGYFVRRNLQLELRDVSKFDAVLAAVVAAGANVIHEVTFATTELRTHRDHARELALKAAFEKASAMATQAGVTLKKPRTISESGGWWAGYNRQYGRSNYMSQNVSQNFGGTGSTPEGTTAPGMISVRATVAVVYDIE